MPAARVQPVVPVIDVSKDADIAAGLVPSSHPFISDRSPAMFFVAVMGEGGGEEAYKL